jgi:hypothetical protein
MFSPFKLYVLYPIVKDLSLLGNYVIKSCYTTLNIFQGKKMRYVLLSLFVVLFFTGCADAVNYTIYQYHEPVGFWYGLWHGAIAGVSFVVSLFDDSVSVYAIYNNGGWYDFGFLIGLIAVWGGGGCHKMGCKIKTPKESKKAKEWEEIGDKIEAKIMRNLQEWVKDEAPKDGTQKDPEWDEIGDKVESKVKRILRKWADKE